MATIGRRESPAALLITKRECWAGLELRSPAARSARRRLPPPAGSENDRADGWASQAGGSGTSPPAKRRATASHCASSSERELITALCCDTNAPSRLPSGRERT